MPAVADDVSLAGESFARLVGSSGDRVLLFEVSPEFVNEDWSEPVQYRFVRTKGGLLSIEMMELRRV